MGKKENVEIALNVSGADESAVDVKKLESAFENLGERGAKIQTPLVRAAEAIQSKWSKATNDMASVTQRDVNSMVKNLNVFEAEIKQSFGSISNAPAELQQVFGKLENQVKTTTSRFGQMQDAVSDNSKAAKLAGDNWTGLGGALEAMGGKTGAAAAKFGLITAALREGWQMGQQFNKFAGTDMAEFERVFERIGKKTNIVMKGMSDVAAESLLSFKALFTVGDGWGDNFIKAATSLGESVIGLKNKVTDLDKAMKIEELQHKANAEAAKTNALATTDLGKIKETLAGQLKSTADALAAENEAIRSGVTAVNHKLSVQDRHSTTLEKLAEAGRAATMVENGLTDSMRKELGILLELLPTHDQETLKLDILGSSLREQIAIHKDGISPAHEKRLNQIVAEVEKLEKGDVTAKKRIETLTKEALAVGQSTTASEKSAVTYDATTRTMTNVTTATDATAAATNKGKDAATQSTVVWDAKTKTMTGVADATKKVATAAESNAKFVADMEAKLLASNTEMQAMINKAPAVVAAIASIGAAAAATAQQLAAMRAQAAAAADGEKDGSGGGSAGAW